MFRYTFNQSAEAIQKVFDEQSYASFSNLCVDAIKGNVVKFSKQEASNEIRKKTLAVAGLSENPTIGEVRRALNRTATREAIFEIISETVDQTLIYGIQGDAWFNTYVDYRNLNLGDSAEFFIPDPTNLVVSEVAAANHDIIRQRIGSGRSITVPTRQYAVKVYVEAERFLMGAEDWSALIERVTKAFYDKIGEMTYESMSSASKDLPSPTRFNVTMQATPTNRAQMLKLCNDVSIASGSKAIILGTGVGLGQLQNMKNTDIFADSEKEDIYTLGRVGHFDQYAVAEIPQAFADATLSKYNYDDAKLLVVPGNIGKFVKFVDEGATEIYENTDRTHNKDHSFDYEMSRKMGVACVVSTVFGTCTIEA